MKSGVPVDLAIVVSVIMILAGIFRLWLMRSGKLPLAFGVQRYFPYMFIGVGVVLLVIAILD